MKITEARLKGSMIIEPDVIGDHRGYFLETYSLKRYESSGICTEFVQDNISFSQKNTLRGLHYQLKHTQAKLVQVLSGEVFDVAVDIRVGSPQFGEWVGVILSAQNKNQFYIPEGFAHGFCVLSDHALFHYKCSDYYAPGDEYGVLWNDMDLGISWPIKSPILSEKDSRLSSLCEIPKNELPIYKGI